MRPTLRRREIISATERRNNSPKHSFKFVKGLLYFIAMLFVLYLVLFSNSFKVKKIQVNGVKSVEISDYLNQTLLGKNIVLLRTGSYLNSLTKKFPILQEVKIVRGLPDTIIVNVSEKNQVMIWCSKDKCYEVDDMGYVYQEINRPDDKAYLVDDSGISVKIGDRITSQQFISFFLKAVDELNKKGIKIKESRIQETTFKLSFVTADGWAIIMDSSSSLNNQISALTQVIEKNKSDIKEYVDLRVEGTAFVK